MKNTLLNEIRFQMNKYDRLMGDCENWTISKSRLCNAWKELRITIQELNNYLLN